MRWSPCTIRSRLDQLATLRRRRRRGQLLGGRAQAAPRAVGGQHRDGEPRGRSSACRSGIARQARRDADAGRAGGARGGAPRARRGRCAAHARAGHGAGARAVGLAVRRCAVSGRARWSSCAGGSRSEFAGGRSARRHADDVGRRVARARWPRHARRRQPRVARRPRSSARARRDPHGAGVARRSIRSRSCAAQMPTAMFADAVQIVLSERTDDGRARPGRARRARTWRVADLHTKHMMLRAGLGWGNLPEHIVREDLERAARRASGPRRGRATSTRCTSRSSIAATRSSAPRTAGCSRSCRRCARRAI